jgi:hypothetical protein
MKLERPPRAIKQKREGERPRGTAGVRRSMVGKSNPMGGCVQMPGKMASSACPMFRYVASAFQRRRKTANIHADSGVIWGIPAYRRHLRRRPAIRPGRGRRSQAGRTEESARCLQPSADGASRITNGAER